jgi:RimJ/RimL family protein N-acetyltransferase
MENTQGCSQSIAAGFLKTRRLIFRTWLASDMKYALRLWGDLRVTQFIDSREKISEADVRNRLIQEIDRQTNFGVQYWPIFLRSTGEYVGCCGLRPYDLDRNLYEIGFHVCADHWGQGIATEAALGVMDYAFNAISVKGLFAGHNPNNSASRHILLKLGFRFTHNEFYVPTGLYHPSYILTTDAYYLSNR